MAHVHDEWEAAKTAELAAAQKKDKALRAFWDAEDEWDKARERTQRAFVALANAAQAAK